MGLITIAQHQEGGVRSVHISLSVFTPLNETHAIGVPTYWFLSIRERRGLWGVPNSDCAKPEKIKQLQRGCIRFEIPVCLDVGAMSGNLVPPVISKCRSAPHASRLERRCVQLFLPIAIDHIRCVSQPPLARICVLIIALK